MSKKKTKTKNVDKKIEKLTSIVIEKLTSYYSLAIRTSPDLIKYISNDVWVSYFHKFSTDEDL